MLKLRLNQGFILSLLKACISLACVHISVGLCFHLSWFVFPSLLVCVSVSTIYLVKVNIANEQLVMLMEYHILINRIMCHFNLCSVAPPDFVEQVKNKKYLSNLNANQTILFKNLQHKEILGIGTLGCVKLVVDKTTKKAYALKSMRKSNIVSLNATDNILSERAILAEIDRYIL